MGRNKVKEGKQVNFYLDEQDIMKLKLMAGESGLTNTGMIEKLINDRYDVTDIGKKERELEKKRLSHIEAAEEIKLEQDKIKAMMPLKEAWDKEFKKLKNRYVDILKRKINEDAELSELSILANNHSLLLKGRYTADELLNEAYNE